MTPVVVSSVTPLMPCPMRVQYCPSSARVPRRTSRMTPYSSESASVASGTAPSASTRVPRWTSSVASPPSSRSMLGPTTLPSSSRNSNSRWVHHQYSGSVSPFQAKTGTPVGCSGVPSPTTIAAAAWSWVEKMLQLTQRTSAPSAFNVSIRTAVCTVMCSEPAMRAPASGCRSPYSSRSAMRPGISCSARVISLRPNPARDRSATLKSSAVRTRSGVVTVMSLRCRAVPMGWPASITVVSRMREERACRGFGGLVPSTRIRPVTGNPRAPGSRPGVSRLGDADDDLLVVGGVRLVLDLRSRAFEVFLPRAELAVVLPAGPVEELVEDDHRAGQQPRPDQGQHRDRRRVEVAVDVQEVHRPGMGLQESRQGVVEPADHQLSALDLGQPVDGEGALADVRPVVLGKALEGVEAVHLAPLAGIGDHREGPALEDPELEGHAALGGDVQRVHQRAHRVVELAGRGHQAMGEPGRAERGGALPGRQEVPARPELDLPDRTLELRHPTLDLRRGPLDHDPLDLRPDDALQALLQGSDDRSGAPSPHGSEHAAPPFLRHRIPLPRWWAARSPRRRPDRSVVRPYQVWNNLVHVSRPVSSGSRARYSSRTRSPSRVNRQRTASPRRANWSIWSRSKRRTRTPSCEGSVTTAVSNSATCHQCASALEIAAVPWFRCSSCCRIRLASTARIIDGVPAGATLGMPVRGTPGTVEAGWFVVSGYSDHSLRTAATVSAPPSSSTSGPRRESPPPPAAGAARPRPRGA